MSLINEIELLLDQQVRPKLALHQGDITVQSLNNNILTVRLRGACSNCPSANLTTEELVSTAVRQEFPQIQRVDLDAGVSDDLMAQARAILVRRHSGTEMQ